MNSENKVRIRDDVYCTRDHQPHLKRVNAEIT
jgi:hypothetical protein